MQGQGVRFRSDLRANVQAFIGTIEPHMLLILQGLLVQLLECLPHACSVHPALEVHAIALEHLFDGAPGQARVLPLEQPHPLMFRVLKRLVPGGKQLGARALRHCRLPEFLIDPESADGIGQQGRRRAPTVHQAQHVIIDCTDLADLRQHFIAQGCH
ncbi:hypothetical protein D3C81_1167330 [compost metagenome]